LKIQSAEQFSGKECPEDTLHNSLNTTFDYSFGSLEAVYGFIFVLNGTQNIFPNLPNIVDFTGSGN